MSRRLSGVSSRALLRAAAAALISGASLVGLHGSDLAVADMLVAGSVAASFRSVPVACLLAAVAGGFSAIQGGPLGGAALLLAGLCLVLHGAPGGLREAVARLLAPASLAAAYPLLFVLLASRSPASGRAGLVLGLPAGRGLLLVLLSAHVSLAVWSSLHPGRSAPSVGGFTGWVRRRVEILVAAPVAAAAAAGMAVSPLGLVAVLVGLIGYAWARFLLGSRLMGLAAFTLIYGALLYALGLAGAANNLLGG